MNHIDYVTQHLPEFEDVCFFVDVSALMERAWTGLAQVTAHIAREVHKRFPERSFFFVREKVVDPYFLMTAIESAPGGYLEVLLSNGYGDLGNLTDFVYREKSSVGIFPNVKRFHRICDIELVVVHDLSSILMPELHEAWAADLHGHALIRDCKSSDLICCVSEATRRDAVAYLGLEPTKTFVSHLGVAPPEEPDIAPVVRQDFILVLGTVEPRKNLRLVAEFLASRPDVLENSVIVFVGRRGWGPQFNQIFGRLIEDPRLRDRFAFTGFVSEADKWALMRSARFAIFPSMFEGFGLPVLECMAAGCPIITSRSSSLVEFDLPQEMYFDPFSLADFSRAFRSVSALTEGDRKALGEQLQRKAEAYTWQAFSDRIFNAVQALKARSAEHVLSS